MTQAHPVGENPINVMEQLAGRQLMTPPLLLKALHEADWPELCLVHPADFLALTAYCGLAKDDEGYYFIMSNTKVRPSRPPTNQPNELDLTNYDGPGRIVIARPVDPALDAKWDKK